MPIDALEGAAPPPGAIRIRTLDMHTGGEPLRVIVEGLPDIPGATVLEKRRWFAENADHLRTALMWEPRGHADMYGAVLSQGADGALDVFFIHNEGYSTMCGHAIIALTRLAVESGLVPPGTTQLAFNAPCGRIEAEAELDGEGRVIATGFRNVPCYVLEAEGRIEVPGIGEVRYDIAYGGAYYAIVEAAPLGLALDASDYRRLIDIGQRIKLAIAAARPIPHPFEPDLGFLYGTIFTGPAHDPAHHSRNVCIFADGEVDRSPTGSGVSARAALHHLRGELGIGQQARIESILGSTMTVEIVGTTRYGPHDAVIPRVGGTAHYMGSHEFWIEPGDPFAKGFFLR